MKNFFGFGLIVFISLLVGCSTSHEAYDFKSGGGTETIGVEWKGSLTKAPDNPDTNSSYLNKSDNVAYIWSGENWDTLAVSDTTVAMKGLSEVSLRWKGARSEAPLDPEVHWAYYDRSLYGSFIWDSTAWSLLAKDTDILHTLIWKGILETAPTNPEENWAYYNTTEGKSYLYRSSQWELFDKDDLESMENGIPIRWKGSFINEPINPIVNMAYFNSNDNNTYIYDGSVWSIFAINGNNDDFVGLDGVSIHWKGTYDSAPENPSINDGYYESTLKASFLWNGEEWTILFMEEVDSTIIWEGAFSQAPANPVQSAVYFNTTDKKSYVHDGAGWYTLTRFDLSML